MALGLQKTIVFLLFILIGFLLKTKLKSKQEIAGIKAVILNLALPATIFIALLQIKLDWDLLFLPLFAIILNMVLFLCAPLVLRILGFKKGSPDFKTAHLLFASLAPGLSCFPFVLEFLGETYLAKAAMADLGNKVFVLLALYLIAMNWHRKTMSLKNSKTKGLGNLLKVMVCEPVNLFIFGALLLLGLGYSINELPFVFSDTLKKLSLLMTPLVLLYIGLAVKLKKGHISKIVTLLTVRSGLALVLVGVTLTSLGISIREDMLLLMAFSLSACSFWPFAHLAAADTLENNLEKDKRTFNPQFAVAILAFSFPISTIFNLTVLNTGDFFSNAYHIIFIGLALLVVGFIRPLTQRVFRKNPGPAKPLLQRIGKPKLQQMFKSIFPFF